MEGRLAQAFSAEHRDVSRSHSLLHAKNFRFDGTQDVLRAVSACDFIFLVACDLKLYSHSFRSSE